MEAKDTGPVAPATSGALVCVLDPERSRVTGPAPEDLPFDWSPSGCVNSRTQYGFADGVWSRVLVPDEEAVVSVNSFDPATREYRVERYLLDRAGMERVRKAPESVSFAFGTSRGNANHIGIALAMKAAGIDPATLKIVVYKASIEATTALMGGHVDVVATPMSTYLPVLGSGKIRIVAIAAPQRVGGRFADVPTWKEQGFDAVMPSYRMFIAARGLDAAQRRYWDGVFARIAKSPEWQKELAANEWQSAYMNGADSVKYLEARYSEYRRILTELKLAK